MFGRTKQFPEYKGKKLCQICAYEVFTGEDYSDIRKKGHLPKGELKVEAEIDEVSDFATLKDLLKKNGIVMPAFNCPKCNNMVDIPENGKLLICKHCGNPIKPVDVYEKIKQLL